MGKSIEQIRAERRAYSKKYREEVLAGLRVPVHPRRAPMSSEEYLAKKKVWNREHQRKYRQEQPAKVKAYMQAWHLAHPDAQRRYQATRELKLKKADNNE